MPAAPRIACRETSNENRDPDRPLLDRLAVVLLVLSCGVPLALNVADPDLWGHVLYGQEWIAEGQLPSTATHTFTAEGHPWVNHENLAEWLLARGFPALGTRGMLAAKAAVGMLVLLLMANVFRRRGVAPIVGWSLLLLVAYALQAFFPLRPQVLSFLWCAVMLWLLDRAFADDPRRKSDLEHNRRRADPRPINWRPLLVLPLLLLAWGNSHGGFVAGLALMGGVFAGKSIELAIRWRGPSARVIAGLAAVWAASFAATLMNPYGWGLHAWLLESLGAARPEITEWGPPLPGNPVFAPFVTLVAVAIVSLAFSDRRRDPTQVVLLALVAWQAASHLRHIAFFALLCGFWLPPHVQSAFVRVRDFLRERTPTSSAAPWMRNAALAAVMLGIVLQSVSLGRRLATLPVYRSTYPVDAIQWMSDHQVRGNLVVNFNWAQYAIAALAPDVRVAFDGRFRTCYPQTVIDRHFDFLMADRAPRRRSPDSGPIDSTATLRKDQPDYVLIDRKYPEPVAVMAAAAKDNDAPWTLVYQDAIAQLWARRELVDDPASSRHVPADRRFVSDHFSTTAVEWPALPRPTLPPQTKQEVAEGERRPATARPVNG